MILLIITPPMIGTAETLKPNLCRGRPERGPVHLPVAVLGSNGVATNAHGIPSIGWEYQPLDRLDAKRHQAFLSCTGP
jgi:hypothetical protein